MLGFLIYVAPWFAQRTPMRAVVFGIFGALLVLIERWLTVPADTGWSLALGFVFNAVLSTVLGAGLSLIKRQPLTLASKLTTFGKLGLVVLILLAMMLSSMPLFRAGSYYRLGNVQVKQDGSDAFSEIDINSIVVVPLETAQNKARQVVGQFGSQFSLGNFYLQRFQNQLVYVAPLEPNDIWAQWNAGTSPGYVTISATDSSAPAKLVTGFKLKYTQQSFLNQWVDRRARSAYKEPLFIEFSFELDEDGKPFWVGSAGHYAVGTDGIKVDQAVVVDAQSGAVASYPLDKLPDWIDQAIPEANAAQYTEWWGLYGGGYWNSVFTQRGVKKLTHTGSTGRSMVGVNGADGRFRYFSGLTSPNPKDTSLVGYMLVDARTGAMTFHQVPGVSSEENITRVVENEYKAQKYVAGYPLPYNIYGRFTWVVPVLDSHDNGQWMGVALVTEDASTVVTGKSLPEALRLFKARMSGVNGAGPTATAKTEQFAGTIERIAQATEQGTSVYYMVLTEKPGKVFTAPLGLNPHLTVTRPGDKVALEYADTGEGLIPVTAFRNLNLAP
jgi:hypothetical protein